MLPSATRSSEWCLSCRFSHQSYAVFTFLNGRRGGKDPALSTGPLVSNLWKNWAVSIYFVKYRVCWYKSLVMSVWYRDVRTHWSIECIRAIVPCNLENLTVTTNISCLPYACMIPSKYVYPYRRSDRLVRPCRLLFINVEQLNGNHSGSV
jgi:hypothetical protein